MKININGNPLDFTLEDEKTLQEVYRGIENWLGQSRLAITGLSVDKENCPLSQLHEWKDLPLEGIEQISIEAQGLTEIQVGRLQTLLEYFQMLRRGIENTPPGDLKEILQEFSYVEEGFGALLGEKTCGPDSLLASLRESLEETGATSAGLVPEDQKKRVIGLIEPVLSLLQERIKEYLHPRREIESVGYLLQNLLPQISEVSLLLQNGEDKKAMNLVIHFTELFSKLLRLLSIIQQDHMTEPSQAPKDKSPIAAFQAEMNQILEELIEAFHAEDTVLIGDLLEYEVVPKMESLPQLISEIKDESGEDGNE